MIGAAVAGFGSVVERERFEGSEDMGWWGQMNCRKVWEENWVMRFMMEVVVEDERCGSRHEEFHELFQGMFALFAFSWAISTAPVSLKQYWSSYTL